MAIVKCRECGAPVSTAAKACPGCGAPMPKKTSLLTWLVTIFVAVPMVIGTITAGLNRGDGSAGGAGAAAPQTPAQRAADEVFAQQQRLARAAMAAIKAAANDPDSIKFTALFVTDGKTVCAEYRGKNSFGALVKNSAVFPYEKKGITGTDKSSDLVSNWNKYCADKKNHDMGFLY